LNQSRVTDLWRTFTLQARTTAAPVIASLATWAPTVNARRARPAACTSAPAGKARASRSAVEEASAAATSVSATSRSLGRSMAASASAMTSPARGIKASSAQSSVSCVKRTVLLGGSIWGRQILLCSQYIGSRTTVRDLKARPSANGCLCETTERPLCQQGQPWLDPNGTVLAGICQAEQRSKQSEQSRMVNVQMQTDCFY
ncbi:hypothetical protein XENOCAPTIV_011900, partial [Xenoophorus captivus]